ncbi:hypothetical protein Tsubulata_043530 [Turnera subulata]|uniref:Endoplasmic reticulum vesicle transporter C-terminal domain-containing protein n=1 Tax=Turnera subulata TaxID=218843 RepID=A0A9Q0FI02_9ROSI|nr:hypothetical protein Tsubulata_043530 [Turnera subulata]
MNTIVNKLKNLDAYPKINEDFYNRTLSGGIITLVSSFVMFLLFFSEFRSYWHTVTETKLLVDTSRGESLRINFDITFPAIRCSLLSLDAMDISGEQHLDIRHDITKKRINPNGDVIEARQEGIGAPKIEKPLQRHGGRLEHNEIYCGSCYGAEMSDDDCCNSCDDVREAYRRKGWAVTNVDLIDQISHRINRLAFGDYFPGVVNPLDGAQLIHNSPNGMQQYFIKVVPTIYTDIRGRTVQSNQYSVTEHFKQVEVISPNSHPGVFFVYDFSPIKVTFKEEHISFLQFLTSVCAIVGGIFTIAGIADSFVYHGQKAMKKKVELGKYR